LLTEYHNLVVSGVIRTIVGFLVLFGLMPYIVMPVLYPDEPWRRRAAYGLLAGAFTIGSVHLLVLAGMFDSVSWFVLALAIWVARTWYAESRESGRGFRHIFAGILRLSDAFSWRTVRDSGRDRMKVWWAHRNGLEAVSIVILAGVIAAAGLIRLLPVWNNAAPFAVEYYETLEHVKRLQLNQMYIQGYRVPLGLPMIAQTLSLLSQVNVAVELHFLGAISSMALAASIAYVVYRSTHSLQGSIIAAAFFGMFNQFLPMNLHHQVEADSVVLASAFMLPSLSFLAEFCIDFRVRTLVIALAGLLSALAVNVFVGSAGIVAAAVVLVSALLFVYRNPALHNGRLYGMIGGVAVLLGGFALFVRALAGNEFLKNAAQLLLYDQHVNRYSSSFGELSPAFLWVSAVLFCFPVLLSLWRFSDRGLHLQLFSWGASGIALLLLVQYSSDEMFAMVPVGQVGFLFSVLVPVTLGIAVGWVARAGNEILGLLKTRPWAGNVWKLIVVCTGLGALWFVSPAQTVRFEHTVEPDGFAKSIYLIEQRYTPFQWTVVSHRGTALSGMNRGRFLDYGYFTSRYNPETYKHGAKDAVPTPVLFIFVELAREETNVATELATGTARSAEVIKDWIDSYRKTHVDLSVFYRDDEVVVYKIEDPAVNALRE
jgi:hypothetical protein